MRGIERFLAAVLLVGAVGGAAAFARYAGTEPAPPAFRFSASPRQHLTIPQTVVQIPVPADGRAAVKPVVAARPVLRPAPTVPAQGVVVTPVRAPAPAPVAAPPAPPSVQTPTPTPAPAPATPVAAPAAPAPVAAPAAPVRTIAAVPAPVTAPPQPPPAPTPTPKKHGKAKGHDKHLGVQANDDNQGDDDEAGDVVTPSADAPCAAAPVDQTPAAPAPVPTDGNGDSQGNGGPGNGNGNGNANGHGHGNGG
jgi:hypothetical protein